MVFRIETWLEKSRITKGVIFCGMNRWGELNAQPLTPLAVNQIFKRAGESSIPHPEQFSSHSLRCGLATSASREGASLKAIMCQGRWQQVSTVLGYIEEGQPFHNNAANVILQEEMGV